MRIEGVAVGVRDALDESGQAHLRPRRHRSVVTLRTSKN